MLPYWMLFLLPAFAALRERPMIRRSMSHGVIAGGVVLLLTALIGLRYEVGGDWSGYLGYLDRSSWLTFGEVFLQGDPGYILLNWLAVHTVGEIWGVNLLCGLLFSIGLVSFVKVQPRPWLALLVAVPYLVIVVAMGYSRQAVAIGLALMGLVSLTRDRSVARFVMWVALAATFHKTALLLVPIAALSADRGRIWTAMWVAGATLLLYYLFLEDSVGSLMAGYVGAEYQSQGAVIRVTMNALPAVTFLLLRQRLQLNRVELRLWTSMALFALVFVILLLISPSSTAVDRMALYFIPLQLFVLSRLPDALSGSTRGLTLAVVSVVVYSAAVQFIWLNFASYADAWLPYQFYPLL